MKTIPILLFFTFILTGFSYSQNINGRFSSSIYTFERFDSVNASNTYARTYQTLSLNLNQGLFSLRTSMNLENEILEKFDFDPRVRFYNLYLEGRNLFDIATIKIGRQPIFNSVVGGVFDGANLDLKYSVFKLTGYYGGNVPAYQKLEVTNDFKNDFIAGAKLTANPVEELRLAVSYVNKNFKKQDYLAQRLDEDLNPVVVLIRNKSNQFSFVSGEASYDMKDHFSIDTRYDYDLNFEKSSRFEANASYKKVKDFNLNFYYNYREPRISYNSIFSVFDYGNSQEMEFGGDYNLEAGITLSGRIGNVIFEDLTSQRITLGASTSFGNISFRKNLKGWVGELDNLSLYAAHTFLDGFITPSAGLSFTSYKLSKYDNEKNTLVSLLAGLNVRPYRSLSFDLQGQYLNNKIYKNDMRLFFKINYWFNTNLNLM